MQRTTLAMISAVTLAACAGEIGDTGDDDGDGDGDGSNEPVTCEQARTYAGFGGALEVDRPQIEPSSDRMRTKPFAALSAEYTRVLGLASFNTSEYAATFGRPPARWYSEPAASANTIYAAFALGYSGCTQKTAAGGDFATAPSAQIADRLCRDFQRAAWMREPTDAEAAACSQFAIDKTNPADTPAKRWAYTCAAVLSASGFLAY